MIELCTLFDSNYLSRALAMYRSLDAVESNFTLHAYCFDDLSLAVLADMKLPHLKLYALSDFETPQLLEIKKTRSKAEYCWTCTPQVIRHTLDYNNIPSVTYVDADLFFLKSPRLLLDELQEAGGAVLLTEHRFSPGFEHLLKFGRFCVQFMTFHSDQRGRKVLDWWAERCMEWCGAKLEEGRFGDQLYLEDWESRFTGVHVLRQQGALGPWNIEQYRLVKDDTGLTVDGDKAVFFHFHNIKRYTDGLVDLGFYRIPKPVLEWLYAPYLAALEEAEDDIRLIHSRFDGGFLVPRSRIALLISRFLRGRRGVFNVYQESKLKKLVR